MSHPIGNGTVNLTINLPAEERAELASIAVETDRSLGAVVREMVLAGIKGVRPDAADRIERIRRARRAAILAVAVIAAIGVLVCSWPEHRAEQPIFCIGE